MPQENAIDLDFDETIPETPDTTVASSDAGTTQIQGFLIGQRADKAGSSLVSKDRRPVLREFRASDRYKELTNQHQPTHTESARRSLMPQLKALRALHESGRGKMVSPRQRAAAMRLLFIEDVPVSTMFRAINGHTLITEEDQSLATNLMAALVQAGHDRNLVEVEVSEHDNSIYVYLDDTIKEKLNEVLALLGDHGDATIIQRPEDDPKLGAYQVRVRPKKEHAAVAPDLPVDGATCEPCKSEAVILTSEFGGTLRCATCGHSAVLTEREQRVFYRGLCDSIDDPEEGEVPPECPGCGGSSVGVLGTFGTRRHYRCRDCGMDSSIFVGPLPKDPPEGYRRKLRPTQPPATPQQEAVEPATEIEPAVPTKCDGCGSPIDPATPASGDRRGPATKFCAKCDMLRSRVEDQSLSVDDLLLVSAAHSLVRVESVAGGIAKLVGFSSALLGESLEPLTTLKERLKANGDIVKLGRLDRSSKAPVHIVFESNRKISRVQDWYNILPTERKPLDAKLEVLRAEQPRQFSLAIMQGYCEDACRHLHATYEAKFLSMRGLGEATPAEKSSVQIDRGSAKDPRFFLTFEHLEGDDLLEQARQFSASMSVKPIVRDGRGRYGFVVDYATYRKLESFLPMFSGRLFDVHEPLHLLAEQDPNELPLTLPPAEGLPPPADAGAMDPAATDPALAEPEVGTAVEPHADLVDDVIREVRAGLYGEWPPFDTDVEQEGVDQTISGTDIEKQMEKAFVQHGVAGPRRSNADMWRNAYTSLIQFAKIDSAATASAQAESKALSEVFPPKNPGGQFMRAPATAPRFGGRSGPTGVPRVAGAGRVVPGAVSTALKGVARGIGRGIGAAVSAIPGAKTVQNIGQKLGVAKDNRTLQTARQLAADWAPSHSSALYQFASSGRADDAQGAAKAIQELGSIYELVAQARSSGRASPDIVDRENEIRFLHDFFRSLSGGAMGTKNGMGAHYARLMYPNLESVKESSSSDGSGTSAPAKVSANVPVLDHSSTGRECAETSTSGAGAIASPADEVAEAERQYEALKLQQAEIADRPQAQITEEVTTPGSAAVANSKLKSLGVDNFEFTDQSWTEFDGLAKQGWLPMSLAVHFGLPIGSTEELIGWMQEASKDKVVKIEA